MILFTRVEARNFHALFARCIAGRPRGPAPPIVIRFAQGTRTLTGTTGDGVMLMHTVPSDECDDLLVLPGSILPEVEGSTDEGVTLDRQSKLRGLIHWQGGSKPRKLPVELILPGKQHENPALPSLTPVSAKVLSALHECGRSAARDSGRFALSKVQLQGRAGRVIGTDGTIALLYGGFKFGFTDDVLVSALPVFGAKPLSRVSEVKVGRTETHLVIVAGPWSVWLPFDTKARYPDVSGIIPKHPSTTAGIDEQDAVEMLKVLPTLPGNKDEMRPVTVDVNGSVKIRGRDPDTSETKEITLIRSRSTGPRACVALDRRFLARALSVGCHTLKLTPDKPFVLEGDGICFVALPLDPAMIVPAKDDSEKAFCEVVPTTAIATIDPERSRLMETPKLNGHTPSRGDPPDPLFAAEELRDALVVVTAKAARLVAALKAGRKEKKVLASVFANLKQLGLDSGGPP